ncbi:hypothetical protein lerEdw1_002172 [Lerista edwardsae]|nr:hypothetical protein lerEdw1_002172 [Lerista edwardsae]
MVVAPLLLCLSSAAEESAKASFERRALGHSKVFLPPSQDMVLSSGSQCMVRNVLESTERTFQNTMSPSLGLTDLFLSKGEDAGDQVTLPYEEWSGSLSVKMQEQERIRSINNDDASHQKMGIANNLLDICEKEMPEKQISFLLQTSDNEDAEDLKKGELLFGSLTKKMSFGVIAEDNINSYLKSSQENHTNRNVEQNKASQDIIKSGSVEETNWPENGSREDAGFVEHRASQTQNENRTKSPLVTDLSIFASEEQNSNLHISSVSEVGSDRDGKGIDQHPLYRSAKVEEQSDICSSTDVLEADGAQYNSTISEKPSDQHSLRTSGKPGEQNSPCRKIIVTEQNNYEGQDTSGKDFPNTWSVFPLEKEIDISEPKCKPVIETSNLSCPLPDGDVHSGTRKTSVQPVLSSEEKGPGMTAKPIKNTDVSQERENPILIQPPQQWKENECEKLVSNIKLELDEYCLRPSEITETLFSTSITHQNLTKIPETETKPKTENSPSSTDVHMNGQEVVMCGENKSQPIHVESCLPSSNVLSQLEREMGSPTPNRDTNADSEAQQPLLASCTGYSICASSDFDTVTQTPSLCRDPLNLPHSQLHGISESNSLEFPLSELTSLDDQHIHSKGKIDQYTAEGTSGIESPLPVVHAGLGHPNNAKVEITERICDLSEQEDATDVVCGLIKELSNLNRLIMSKHRDLDSFKRTKFRRNRQSGKSMIHSINNMASTLCTVKRKKEI